ncbi:hypothetical protein N3K66_007364 [Trichothecium roseum]|uniref:Uncharacterized protein n=1 Tax=Trichothecium roseum TaxID=47278 RepID=A0ACC0UTU8_9HYPO|nr:hypothetical protein N3K66_007364 [Trichothecium roseum]
MPPKSTSVVPYAAGASLAAVALIYVFGPTFTLDTETSSNSSKRKTIVGLRNQANDCFINSILQVLAGLTDLRIYLIRETHRRSIESPGVYQNLIQPEPPGEELPEWKLEGLQNGVLTKGLKDMLDALNERPIYKKTVSPFPLVRVLETAFKQRISRQQQDAQEFLQIVAERLKDEYHAGSRARLYARRHGVPIAPSIGSDQQSAPQDSDSNPDKVPDLATSESSFASTNISTPQSSVPAVNAPQAPVPKPASKQVDLEESFPMEGKYESQLECLTCRYKTKPREDTFCTLTLAVPQVSSTTLNNCFDGIFKTEYIDDFKCENCRLVHVKTSLEQEMARSSSDSFKAQASESIRKLQEAIEKDPENPPPDVDLGDSRHAPKRKISKTTRMTNYPKILAVHLSRSIYGTMVSKNSAKVAFPERLPLGGLTDQRKYKLLGVVTHRGGHNSGHYEAFRRQNLAPPFANANTFQPSEVYSKTPTPMSTPEIVPKRAPSPSISTPELLSPASGNSSTPSLESLAVPPRSTPTDLGTDVRASTEGNSKEREGDSSSLRSVAASTKSAISRLTSSKDRPASPKPGSTMQKKAAKKRKAASDKWWRVSDEKVKEAKTSEVLNMQKEVYLLFYELDKEES